MRTKRVLAGLAFLLLVTSGCQQKKDPERIFDRKFMKVIHAARQEAYIFQARNFIPGGSVALSIDGKLVWSEGLGQASTDLEVPATRFTKYRMGQVTQVLTSLAYYRMAGEKVLDPGEMVWKYLPDFPEKKYQLKLQHLVDQTSGIRQPTDQEVNWRGLNTTLRKGIENFSADTLLFPPGMYQYPTIYNFTLLGAVMEEVTGHPFSKVLSQWVIDTLKLENTVPDNPLATIKGWSDFYDRNLIAQTINAVTYDLRYRMSSDGYLSTAEDLVKLGNALLSSPVLPDSIKKRMFTPPLVNNESQGSMGNGLLFLADRQGKPFYAARANVRGSAALLLIYPEEKLVLAWMTNLSDEGEELPVLRIANMFRDFLTGNYGKAAETVKERKKPDKQDSTEERVGEDGPAA